MGLEHYCAKLKVYQDLVSNTAPWGHSLCVWWKCLNLPSQADILYLLSGFVFSGEEVKGGGCNLKLYFAFKFSR